jgi:NTP pyrophosphatase (non-canonical NTP hydrolase)
MLNELREALRDFVAERDWDQFHSPKNLAMALTAEAGELLEHFQWITEEQSASVPPEVLEEIRMEMADVLLYLVRLADKLDVDLVEAAHEKMQRNRKKYPVEKARGRSTKYDKL